MTSAQRKTAQSVNTPSPADPPSNLAWVVPISPPHFLAHLQVHDETKPKLEALDNSSLSQLPLDLILEIMEYVRGSRRHEVYQEREKEFRCWESRCEERDHYTQQEVDIELRSQYESLYSEEYDSFKSFVEEIDISAIMDDIADCAHAQRRRHWETNITRGNVNSNSLLEETSQDKLSSSDDNGTTVCQYSEVLVFAFCNSLWGLQYCRY